MSWTEADKTWSDIYFTSRDGLRLHARHYRAPGSTRRPLLCLPGLTRNARDFHRLATRLADPAGHRRDVVVVDYRGRGHSEWAKDWKTYSPYTELLDTLDLMTLVGMADAAVLGTSRGGIIAMLMATLRPTAIGAAILNDIGPVIEREGLARIVGYVGRMPLPTDWAEATALIKDLNRRDFPGLADSEWAEVARQLFNDEGGLPMAGYDPALSKSISLLEGPPPALWPQFGAMQRIPVLVIRGENSDILSVPTLDEMHARHPRLEALTVKGQGHAPLLRDETSIAAIQSFLIATDSVGRAHGPAGVLPGAA